ncbi:MAG TPA: LPS export ABC transporter periplasmic protein LptC [Novosphingobium sp.]|nr:LPS export ABC transporter periplasmic protein LptC [Novosphingobium sp.]HZV09049.1 LPS export ABC transporter periplasmic protein LptC [Novosphingobium sp.]
MSETAASMRDRRRAWALPGGNHDRWVGRLARGLPAAVGMIVAAMVVTPLFPRGDVSFLLDRNKVAITEDRLQVSGATYRGEDDEGRPFWLTAGRAVQHSAHVARVQMEQLVAHLQMADGLAQVTADRGTYDLTQEQMQLQGPVNISRQDGYRILTNDVSIDVKHRRAYGESDVRGTLPEGHFTADRMTADLAEKRVVLEGHAHLRMSQSRQPRKP